MGVGASDCCTRRENDELTAGSSTTSSRGRAASLEKALESFRSLGEELVEEASGDLGLPRWDGAFEMISTLLLGVQQHCKATHIEADVSTPQGKELNSSSGRVLSITVRFEPRIAIGEIATRSHLCCDVFLESPVKFSLIAPPEDIDHSPLAIEVEGWHFAIAPEIREMRYEIEQELGKNYQPDDVYEWWLQKKDHVWPLQTSKAHKVLATLFDNPAFRLTVPHNIKVNTLWALLHGVSTSIRRLEFAEEADQGLRVALVRAGPVEPDTAEDVAKSDEILQATLVRDKHAGEIFGPSSFNFLRLLHGHSVGQPGGSVKKLTKLLTAAQSWGPGKNSWQQYDETWLATDEKDMMGRVRSENGRLVWRSL